MSEDLIFLEELKHIDSNDYINCLEYLLSINVKLKCMNIINKDNDKIYNFNNKTLKESIINGDIDRLKIIYEVLINKHLISIQNRNIQPISGKNIEGAYVKSELEN
jgi:hypothetical protein